MQLFCNMDTDMRIFTEQALKEFAQTHPESKVALQVWSKAVKKSDWKNFADVKKTFNSVDAIGGNVMSSMSRVMNIGLLL